MPPKKSDTVTREECSWDFMDNEDAVTEMERARYRVQLKFPEVDVSDCYQEMVLFFAARPARTKEYLSTGDQGLSNFGLKAYQKMSEVAVSAMRFHQRFDQGWN